MQNQEQVILCTCCCETFTTQQPPMEIKICKHYFHESCINRWFQECGQTSRMASCPLCRQQFQKTDLQIRKDILQLIIKNSLEINIKVILLNNQVKQIKISNQKLLADLYKIIMIHQQLQNDQFELSFGNKKLNLSRDGQSSLMDLQITNGQEINVVMQGAYQVFLKTIEGNTQTIDVNSQMKASQFITVVSILLSVKEEQVHFVIGTKAFSQRWNQNLTLDELGFRSNSTVHMSLRLLGGYDQIDL